MACDGHVNRSGLSTGSRGSARPHQRWVARAWRQGAIPQRDHREVRRRGDRGQACPGGPGGRGADRGQGGLGLVRAQGARVPLPGARPAALSRLAVQPGGLSSEHQAEQVTAPPRIARRLGLRPGGDLVMRTRYLMSAGGTAIQLVTSYEPVRLTGGTVVAAPEQGPLADRSVIERMKAIGICVDEVAEEISVRPSLRSEATALAIAAGAPVLLVERAHLAAGRAVEACDIVSAAEGFRLRYRIPV